MGLFGGSKQSSASGTSYSGVGLFAPDNEISISKPIINFGEPVQVLSLLAVALIAAYAWKRFK